MSKPALPRRQPTLPKHRHRTHETASLCLEVPRPARRPTSPSHPPPPHLDPLSLLAELAAVKSEYTHLKDCYGVLLREKEQTARENTERSAAVAEAERWRRVAAAAEGEAARIKKECYRMVENERLRTRKLEELLQEKELVIAHLRKSRGNETTIPSANQSALSFLYPHRLTPRDSLLSNVVLEEEDSHREPSKRNDKDARKDLVILHSSSNSDPSQCPTFEHRPEEDFPLPLPAHIPPRPVKSQPKLKPSAKGSRSQSRKLLIVTDENLDGNGRYGSSSVSSRQKKGKKGGKA